MTFPEVVDSSMLSSFKDCPQKFWYNYVRRIRPQGFSIHLLAGGAFSSGLEETRQKYYAGASPREAVLAGLRVLWEEYGTPLVPEKESKTWDNLALAFMSYFDHWPLDKDPFEIAVIHNSPGIEFTFCFPVEDILHPVTKMPMLLAGRVDWIAVRRGSSGLYLVDEKTTKAFQQTWAEDWRLRGQFFCYMKAAHWHGLPVIGMICRGIAIQKTQSPCLQAIIPYSEWKVERWYEQAKRTLRRMIRAWEQNEWEMDLGDSCTSWGGCSYAELCNISDPENWIDLHFVPDTWSPLRTATLNHKELEKI